MLVTTSNFANFSNEKTPQLLQSGYLSDNKFCHEFYGSDSNVTITSISLVLCFLFQVVICMIVSFLRHTGKSWYIKFFYKLRSILI